MTAPSYPVFLGDHAMGFYMFNQDEKQSWEKIPDGSLFLSFGYRGLSKMWLDRRTLPGISQFVMNHRALFDCLKNPWNGKNIRDVSPALDILSSSTQIPDLGAKILLIYCCLEHLFVPKTVSSDNKKFIVGGMHAIGPHLLPWFDRLYALRCEYAHKGFLLKSPETMALIVESLKNAMTLLVSKLSVS